MHAVLLASLLAVSQVQPLEEKPVALTVEYGELHVPSDDNGGTTLFRVGGGVYLNSTASVALALHLKGLQAENDSLKKAIDEKPPSTSSWYIIGGAVLLGLAAGAAASYTLSHH